MYERIDRFERLMGTSVSPEFTNWLIDNGFFTAPASTKYHGAFEGGLFEHSYAVAQALLSLTKDLYLNWMRESSPLLIGMFHDLCKIDAYRHPITGHTLDNEPVYDPMSWEYNKDTKLKGHGDKSIMLLSRFLVLTEEEVMCIRYHMGAFVPQEEWRDYTNAIHSFENVLWTHQADMIASHVMGI